MACPLKGSDWPRYAGKSADAVTFLDLRSMPKGRTISLHVGLLEPGRFDCLPKDHPMALAKQITVIGSILPWVYIWLGWAESEEFYSPPYSSLEDAEA